MVLLEDVLFAMSKISDREIIVSRYKPLLIWNCYMLSFTDKERVIIQIPGIIINTRL